MDTFAAAVTLPLCPAGCGPLAQEGHSVVQCPVCRLIVLLDGDLLTRWHETLLGLHPEESLDVLLTQAMRNEIHCCHEEWQESDELANTLHGRWEKLIDMAGYVYQQWQAQIDHGARVKATGQRIETLLVERAAT